MSATTIRMEKTEPNYLSVSDTAVSWLLTTDHKRIAVLYLASLTFLSCVAVVATGIVHAGLLTPHGGLVSPSNYQQSVTIHGVMMVFFLLFPAIPAVLGNFVLPLMIGARNLVLPRLSLVSWYLYVIGGAMVLWAVASGEIDALWTFSPLSGTSHIPLAMPGLVVATLSSLATSVNIFLTIHKMRTQGLTWFRLPLFVWSLYAFSIAFIVGILAGVFSLVLTVQRSFAPQTVAAAPLSQPLFWLSFQPTMFIALLPALGIVSEVITCFSRRRILGYPLAVLSILAIPPLAFLGWGQYLLAEGETTFAGVVCSLGNVLVAVLVMIQLLIWILTMRKGDITLRAPMFYALGCAALLTIGGVTGLFLAALPTNVYLRDTFFALAHLHYMVAGGVLFGFLTGLHFWWVKITGKMYPELWAKVAAVIIFAGVNLAFFPHLILGSMGMPRRYQWYPEGFQPLYVTSAAGMLVLFAGCAITAVYLLWSLRYGQAAGSNPWGAVGLEWKTESPPVAENFAKTPEITEEPYGYAPDLS